MSKEFVVDYTQLSAWEKCPWGWFERYGRGLRKPKDPTKQSESAMTIGSLTHQAIERYHRSRVAEPSAELMGELNPTYPARMMVKELVVEYLQHCLPMLRDWERTLVEKPLLAKLEDELVLLAKVDTVLFVKEQTTLADGLAIEPGVWLEEYKTKDQQLDRANWMKRWVMDLQGSCQTLAARENFEGVQGVLVTVLEKPRRTKPMRTCKGCGEKFDFYLWFPADEGGYKCPMCGHGQKLDPPKTEGQQPPTSFRLVVQRTEDQLRMAKREIIRRAREMRGCMERWEASNQGDQPILPPNFGACVDPIWGACEFLEAHSQLVDPATLGWVKTDTKRYMEETGEDA